MVKWVHLKKHLLNITFRSSSMHTGDQLAKLRLGQYTVPIGVVLREERIKFLEEPLVLTKLKIQNCLRKRIESNFLLLRFLS